MSLMACECDCCQKWQERVKEDSEFHETMMKLASEHHKKVLEFLVEVRIKVSGLATARQQHDLTEWMDAEMEKLK